MLKTDRWLIIPILVLWPLFFVGGPEYDAARSYKAFWNFGHIIFFALAARYLLGLFNFSSLLIQLILVLSFGALAGVTIEYIQYGLARSPDALDILRNEIGVLIGLLWFRKVRFPQTSFKSLCLCAVPALLGVLWVCFQLTVALLDEYHMRRDFPLLASFESPLELSRWSGEAPFALSLEQSSHRQSSLKIGLGASTTINSKYSGIRVDYLYKNWSAYQWLKLDVFNAEADTFFITLRIHDSLHRKGEQLHNDRFNRRFPLSPGWNQLAIALDDIKHAPIDREMDLTAIEQIGIFTVISESATGRPEKIIYLDNIRLSQN